MNKARESERNQLQRPSSLTGAGCLPDSERMRTRWVLAAVLLASGCNFIPTPSPADPPELTGSGSDAADGVTTTGGEATDGGTTDGRGSGDACVPF